MNPLESRKQRLIAASNLNRAQLAGDITAFTTDVRALTDRAKTLGSIASSAALLMAGLAAVRSGKPVEVDAKPSWMQTLVRSASLASTLWLAFRRRRRGNAGDGENTP
jgi:hypothetical protein